MKWFKNFKVKTKMVSSFLLVIALMAALIAVAIVELKGVSSKYEYAVDRPIEAEKQIRIMNEAITEMRRLTASMVMFAPANDPTRINTYHKDAGAAYENAVEALEIYKNLLLGGTTASQDVRNAAIQKIDTLENALIGYKTDICDPVAAEAREGDYDNAIGYITAGAEYMNILAEQSRELTETAQASAESNMSDARNTANITVWVLLGISFAAAVIALIIALYIANLISKPLIPLTNFMNKAGSTGDLTLEKIDIDTIEEYSKYKDEIGLTIQGAAAFVRRITELSQNLTVIAGGNLALETRLLSDKDTMGLALQNMLGNLNAMFSEINTSSMQVSTGSKQIADGAQMLAQGSTQQSSALEELASSISGVSDKTKNNSAMASKAAELAETIKDNAEKGSVHMKDMITAVNEINDASKSISKVITAIDEIAFQTNILALNAAVEAARAGQHGKGFAVVAEEVRNLAAKSAEAAKETSGMIENSINKTVTGVNIAGETAESLNKIVSGVNDSARLVGEIAKSSEEQSLAISQINIGIEQVAKVIQQNSATAEESAAAADEMSLQSDTLQSLIEQFKLKDSEGAKFR